MEILISSLILSDFATHVISGLSTCSARLKNTWKHRKGYFCVTRLHMVCKTDQPKEILVFLPDNALYVKPEIFTCSARLRNTWERICLCRNTPHCLPDWANYGNSGLSACSARLSKICYFWSLHFSPRLSNTWKHGKRCSCVARLHTVCKTEQLNAILVFYLFCQIKQHMWSLAFSHVLPDIKKTWTGFFWYYQTPHGLQDWAMYGHSGLSTCSVRLSNICEA